MAIFSNLIRHSKHALCAALLLAGYSSAYGAVPTITDLPGTNPTVGDKGTVSLFTGITLDDPDNKDLIVTVSYNGNKGTFNGSDYTASGSGGTYSITIKPTAGQSEGNATTDLRALVFDPAENQVAPGTSENVVFTIGVTDADNETASAQVTLAVTSENDPVGITATVTQLDVNDNLSGSVSPLTTANITDLDTNDSITLTVSVTNTANGAFAGLSGFTNEGGGVYTLTSTNKTTLSNAVKGITFDPVNNRIKPGTTSNSTITALVNDGDTTDSVTRTIRVTSINDLPAVSAGTTVAMGDNETETIFLTAGSTISDVDFDDNLIVEVAYDPTKGKFTAASMTAAGFNQKNTTTLVLATAAAPATAQSKLRQLIFEPEPDLTIVGTETDLTMAIRVIDETAAGDSGSSTDVVENLTVTVTSVNDPPVITNSGSSSFSLTGGQSSFIFNGITLEDPDVESTGGAESDGDDFTATITVTGGVIISSNFTESSSNTFTYVGRILDLQTAIQAGTYSAPSASGNYTVTLKLTDTEGADSNVITYSISVTAATPGIAGKLEGQEVADNLTIKPFSTIEFNSFGTVDVQRTVEVELSKLVGAFDILGNFTLVDPATTGTNYIYRFVGSAVAATNDIQNLRFNPTPNRNIPVTGQDVTFTIRVKEQPTSGSSLTTDSLNVKVIPVNNSPQIGSDSPEYRISDDGTVNPFQTMTLSDPDEGGTQELTVTISLIGQDVDTNLPKAGGGTLGPINGDFVKLVSPADTYQFSGTPTEVNAILAGIVFTPTPDRNSEGERETVTLTVLVEDAYDGTAQRNDTKVIVLAVNGSPVISNVPLLSQQPFPVAGVSSSGIITSNPFADLVITDDALPNPAYDPATDPIEDATIPDTLTFRITIDNPAKGTLAGGGFVETSSGSGIYTRSGTPDEITTALDSVVYTLSTTFSFSLSAPGQTKFTLRATDSPPASNSTTKTFEVIIRERSTAHIVFDAGDYAIGATVIPGSLREAIELASNNDIIVFDFPNDDFPVTIRLARPLNLEKNITIVGSGVDQLSISGDSDGNGEADVSLFIVDNGAELGLEQLTLEYGLASSYGGAVSVKPGASLVARACSFENNQAGQFGGAIDVEEGGLRIEQCLFVDNIVTGETALGGGAISIYSTEVILINNSTFVRNRQEDGGGLGGGAIFAQNSDITGAFTPLIEHCTFSDNYDEANSGSAILSSTTGTTIRIRNNIFADEQGLVLDVLGGGRFDSLGSNIATDLTLTTYTGSPQNTTILDDETDLVDELPLLEDLADNGGATLTCGLLAGSPALDAASISTPLADALAVDQRGVWRGTVPDIGAFEANAFARLNINEIFVENTQFIEIYNSRDSESLDLDGLILYIDGVEDTVFDDSPEYTLIPGAGFDHPTTVELDGELGTIELKNTVGQLLLRVEYVASFVRSVDSVDITGQSITRYPRFEGGFLPHETVVERVTGVADSGELTSPGFDVNGAELDGGNAPPIAIEDVAIFSLLADETLLLPLQLDVINNDVEFDRTDVLKITDIMPVSAGVVYSSELDAIAGYDGNISLTNLPTSPTTTVDVVNVMAEVSTDALFVDYDPSASATMVALSQGETIIDIWGYTIRDYADSVANARGSDDDSSADNIERATSYFLVSVTGVNEAPVAADDPTVATEENQSLRFLVDATLFTSKPNFDFKDLPANYQDFDANGVPGAYLPELQSFALLENDTDVDNDDDNSSLRLVGLHPTSVSVLQTTATSALGATVKLDRRAFREENSVVYDPRGSPILNALSAGESVEDSFYYTIIDQHGATDTAKVTITVTGINDVPTANDDPDYFSSEDELLTLLAVDLLENDTDPDQNESGPDDMPTISNVPGNSFYGAVLDFNGSEIVYNPTGLEFYEDMSRNEVIVDEFVYTITDSNGGSSEATVSIEFVGVNDAPVATNDLLEINENETTQVSAGSRDSHGIYSGGVMANDVDVDFNETTPDDDPWVIPQRSITTGLGASFVLNTDGSYSYDANSATIEGLQEGELAVETFPYVIKDNSRTSAVKDSFKLETNSQNVVLDVLANDLVAGSDPTAVLGYAAVNGNSELLLIESTNHELRDGLLILIEGYEGGGAYNGVYPITTVDRDHFSVPVPFSGDPDGTRGTWRPWFNITAFSTPDSDGLISVAADSQSLIYSPKVNFFGTETLTYTIEDGVGGQDVAVVELLVIDAPLNSIICANDDNFEIYRDQGALEVDVLINDNTLPALGTELTIIETAPIASATGTLLISSNGKTLTYESPSPTFTGTESFAYTVSGSGTSTAEATVTFEVVERENFLIDSEEIFYVVTGSTNNILDVLANDSILPYYPVDLELVSVSNVTTGAIAVVEEGMVKFTPPPSPFLSVAEFTCLIRDEIGNELEKTVKVRVVEAASNFYAVEDNYIVWAGSPIVELPVLENDIATGSNGSDFTISNLGLDTQAPPDASRVDFAAASISYEAPDGPTTEAFTYEITDGSGEFREAVIKITVIDSYPQMTPEDDYYCVSKDTSGHSLDVLANDPIFPVLGWAWTITSADALGSQGGTVAISGGSSLTYTPAAGFFGVETFDYTIEDNFGQTTTATVTVAVGALITSPDEYVVLENSTLNAFNVLLNDDILGRYAEDYTILSTGTPDQGGAVSVDGTEPNNRLLYTPADDFFGIETFTYTVVDQTGGTAVETVTVQILAEESDRDFAELRIEVTGVNDAPILGGTEDDSITDKESTFPFDTLTLSDVDDGGEEEQTATVEFDPTLGTITATGMTELSPGIYQVVGTPVEVVAALRSIEFTPFENLIPLLNPGYFDAVFTLTIDDGYISPVITDLTTIRVFAVNDAPIGADDSYATEENQTIRLLADTTLLPPVVFDFGDLAPNYQDFDANGNLQTYLPEVQTVNLLANDDDVDIDDDNTTIEIVNVHTTDTRVNQITATSALGASIVLDIRAVRAETGILYDPRGSTILNALAAGETIVDTFYYTVIDQHGAEDQALVSITVTGVNDVPTANGEGGFELTEDGTIIILGSEILSNDTDPDQDGNGPDDVPIISNVPPFSDLGATLIFDGTDITYDPDDMEQYESLARNEFLADSFTYTISDENGGSSTALIEFLIEGINDAPVAQNDALAIDENDSQTRDRASGLISNDSDVDMGISFNSDEPNDDPWILPQRTQVSPLGAAFRIETDGSYSYDANSRAIDSLYEGEIAVETFPYIIIDNSRLSAAPDTYKVLTGSTGVVLPVLSNDDVAGSVPVAIQGFSEDIGNIGNVIVESFEHPLREGMLVKIQGYTGDGDYNGVYPISVVDRDHFSVAAAFVDGADSTLGTWRPWFEVTAVSEADQEAVLAISEDGQSILYTPVEAFYGSEQFQYTIIDRVGGQDVAIVELTVLQAPLNTVLSASDDRFQIGKGETSVEVDVLVNDNVLPALGSTYSITDVSVGSAGGSVLISDGNDSLIYTPIDANFVGVETFTYDVDGAGSSTAQATVTFEVIDREGFLEASSDAFFVIEDSVNNLLDVAANDVRLPSFPVSFDVVAVSTPPSGSVSVSGGLVSYTPDPTFVGMDTFTYTIRDASGSHVTETVTVKVVPDVDDFYARNDHYIIVAGSGSYNLDVLINDGVSGAASNNLLIEDLGLDTQAPPDITRIDHTDAVVTYTAPASATTEIFTYEILNGLGTDPRREGVITVIVVDSLPTPTNPLDDAYHVAKNSGPHRLDVLLNDIPLPDAGWSWTITSVTAPTQGGAAVNDGGTAISYTPATGFYGVETFSYTIEDAFGDSALATVTVSVGSQLTEPDVYVVLENSSENDFPVLVNDDILERFAADYTISQFGTPDQGGSVSIDGSGPNNQLLYTPAADFVGEESFTYTVIDNTGAEVTENVTVIVIEENGDRDFANFVVTLTGINDLTQIGSAANGSTTDKLSVKPFPMVTIGDLDEDDLQNQETTLTFDATFGTISAPAFTQIGFGVYYMEGTPAEVQAALREIVFRPYENFIDYIDYAADNSIGDVDFTVSIDDWNLGPALGDSADAPVVDVVTINIEPINDVPFLLGNLNDLFLKVNALPRAILLTPYFDDVDDDVPGGELIWTVAGNTNPSLFASVTVDPAKQLLVITLAPDQFGVADITVRGTDRGGLFVEDTFTVTVDGPPVIELEAGQENPDSPTFVSGSNVGSRRDYRQSFVVTNTGLLPADAFILHVSGLDQPVDGISLFAAQYTSNDNGTPDFFGDDVRSSSGVEILQQDTYAYSVKYDQPLDPGESIIVHLTYRASSLSLLDINPIIEVELTTATPIGAIGSAIIAIPNPETGEVELSFVIEAGKSYVVESTESLETSWHTWDLVLPVSDFDREISILDDGLYTDTHPSVTPQRFYRLIEVVAP